MDKNVERYIGRYEVIQILGEGGMAVVYQALDTRLDRKVAIKVIRGDENLSEKFLLRFEREAKALAKLNHPNIVHINDYGEHEGRPYLVMDYLPGGTLRQKMGFPVPYLEAAQWLAPVARALEYAHNMGIIHRDVKPSNILLSHTGQPMLTDFGVAKLLESEEQIKLTRTGVGIGTPEYMSPEQCYGENVDSRTDVYSLGVVFYEFITGRKPFNAETPMEVMVKQASEPPPSPRSFLPGLPQSVEDLVLTALVKKPELRFQGMGQLAAALETLTAPSVAVEAEDLSDATITDHVIYAENLEKVKQEFATKLDLPDTFETLDATPEIEPEIPVSPSERYDAKPPLEDKNRRTILIAGSAWALIMLAILVIGVTVLVTWGIVELAHYLRTGSVW